MIKQMRYGNRITAMIAACCVSITVLTSGASFAFADSADQSSHDAAAQTTTVQVISSEAGDLSEAVDKGADAREEVIDQADVVKSAGALQESDESSAAPSEPTVVSGADGPGQSVDEPGTPVLDGWVTDNDGFVRYYELGERLSGEQYIEDEVTGEYHWYYFWPEADDAMQVGWSWVPSSEGGKWCYYDAQGRMMYGQQYIDGHWYRFDDFTGVTTYGFSYIADEGKWVFYDEAMGWMLYGQQCVDGH